MGSTCSKSALVDDPYQSNSSNNHQYSGQVSQRSNVVPQPRSPRGRMIVNVDGGITNGTSYKYNHNHHHHQHQQQQSHPPIIRLGYRSNGSGGKSKNTNFGTTCYNHFYSPSQTSLISMFGNTNNNNNMQLNSYYHPDPEIISLYHRSVQIVQEYQTYQMMLLLKQQQEQLLILEQGNESENGNHFSTINRDYCNTSDHQWMVASPKHQNTTGQTPPVLHSQQQMIGQYHLLYKHQQQTPLQPHQQLLYFNNNSSPSRLMSSSPSPTTTNFIQKQSPLQFKNSSDKGYTPSPSPSPSTTTMKNIPTTNQSGGISKSSTKLGKKNPLCLENIVTNAIVGNGSSSANKTSISSKSNNMIDKNSANAADRVATTTSSGRSPSQLQEQRPVKKVFPSSMSPLDSNSSKTKRRSSSVTSSKKKKSSSSSSTEDRQHMHKKDGKRSKKKKNRNGMDNINKSANSKRRNPNNMSTMYQVQFRTRLFIRRPMMYPGSANENNFAATDSCNNTRINNYKCHQVNVPRLTNRRLSLNLLPLRNHTNSSNQNNPFFHGNTQNNNSNSHYYHLQEEGISNTHIYAIRWPVKTKITVVDNDESNLNQRTRVESPQSESHPSQQSPANTAIMTSVEVEDVTELTTATAASIYDVDADSFDNNASNFRRKDERKYDENSCHYDDDNEYNSDDSYTYCKSHSDNSDESSSSIYDNDSDSDDEDEENDAEDDDEESDKFSQLQNDPQMIHLLQQNLLVTNAMQRQRQQQQQSLQQNLLTVPTLSVGTLNGNNNDNNGIMKKTGPHIQDSPSMRNIFCNTTSASAKTKPLIKATVTHHVDSSRKNVTAVLNNNKAKATSIKGMSTSASPIVAVVDDATTVAPSDHIKTQGMSPTVTTTSKSTTAVSADSHTPKTITTTTTTTTTTTAATVTSTSSTDQLFHPTSMALPPKRKVVDWVTVSAEHKIYVADVGLSMEECNHMVAVTEQQCRGQYAAYTYAKQTLGCREFPVLAHAVHDAVHTVVSAIIEQCNGSSGSGASNVTTVNTTDPPNDSAPVQHAQSHRPLLALDDREPHMVKYDVTKKERQKLDMHTDKSEWTFLIAISNGAGMDYVGGGTYFECLDSTVHVQRGHALIFPGKLRHCGQRISTGLRFLLVGFLVDKTPTVASDSSNNITANSTASSLPVTSDATVPSQMQSTNITRTKTNATPSTVSTSRSIVATEFDDDNGENENILAKTDHHLHYHQYLSA